MGTFDRIYSFFECPHCGEHSKHEGQTKELGKNMFSYGTLPYWWEKSQSGMGKEFREDLPVRKSYPNDKEPEVWKDQAERMKAKAEIPDKYKYKDTVECTFICREFWCKLASLQIHGDLHGSQFEAEVKVDENGRLRSPPKVTNKKEEYIKKIKTLKTTHKL